VELVAKLLEATAQVLGEVGLQATSTNKIAARAGVAIGSIYQYFPNKQALIDALLDDRLHRLAALTATQMHAMSATSYPEAAEAILRAAIAFCEAEPELTALLAARTAMPRPGSRDRELYQRGQISPAPTYWPTPTISPLTTLNSLRRSPRAWSATSHPGSHCQ